MLSPLLTRSHIHGHSQMSMLMMNPNLDFVLIANILFKEKYVAVYFTLSSKPKTNARDYIKN